MNKERRIVPDHGDRLRCKVHLADGELPPGRLVVAVSKHCTAVIDGVIHDTHDPAWPDRYGAALGAFAISAGDCSL